MSSITNIQSVYTVCPSYIRDILKYTDNVYLIYNNPIKSSASEENDIKPVIKDKDVSLDLTGNPLQVDLDYSMPVEMEEQIYLYEENNHYPLPLNTIRKLINKHNREINKNESTSSYVYGVCDGSDKNCTLILGAYKSDCILGRTIISHKGCFYQKDSIISLENMRQDHFNNIHTMTSRVDIHISATYMVFGNNLKKYKLSAALPNSACIYCDVAWQTFQYDVPERLQSAEVTIQTMIGHHGSQMHKFWEEFSLLRIYMEMLMTEQSDYDKIILSDNPKNYTDVSEEIYILLNEVQGVRKTIFKKKIKNQLDVNNLRQEQFSDQLWIILTSCNNVGDLKICLHKLFEELAMKQSLKRIISDDNKSSIASIINEISCGKLAVPTLTSAQALECLIELGIEKLKSDYFYILSHYDCLNYQELETYWNETIGKKITRKIRLTVQPTTETTEKLRILNCLLKMHIACDFLVLNEQIKALTEDCFNSLVESVNAFILKRDDVILAKNIPDYMLQEMKVNLHSIDVKFLEGKHPATWNIRMSSSYDRSVVTTIFHHTLKPLFPPNIYNKYDVPADGESDEPIYYVSKLVSFFEKM